MNEELESWRWASLTAGIVMGGWFLHTLITLPSPPPRPPEAVWRATVGTGASRHEIAVYGTWDEALVQAAIARDAACPSPDTRVRSLEQENTSLRQGLQALAGRLVGDEAQLAHRRERGQAVIEAVVRTNSLDWDDAWLAHYGLVRTRKEREPLWQSHRSDERPLDPPALRVGGGSP